MLPEQDGKVRRVSEVISSLAVIWWITQLHTEVEYIYEEVWERRKLVKGRKVPTKTLFPSSDWNPFFLAASLLPVAEYTEIHPELQLLFDIF